jgi:hypothetical protein
MLKEDDKGKGFPFCCQLQEAEEDDIMNCLIFSNEATFPTNGKVSRLNCQIWGTQKPQEITEYERDSPKVNVSCTPSCQKLYGSFFSAKGTVTGQSYLDMLQLWLMPQMQEDSNDSFSSRMGPHPISITTFVNTEHRAASALDRKCRRKGRMFHEMATSHRI